MPAVSPRLLDFARRNQALTIVGVGAGIVGAIAAVQALRRPPASSAPATSTKSTTAGTALATDPSAALLAEQSLPGGLLGSGGNYIDPASLAQAIAYLQGQTGLTATPSSPATPAGAGVLGTDANGNQTCNGESLKMPLVPGQISAVCTPAGWQYQIAGSGTPGGTIGMGQGGVAWSSLGVPPASSYATPPGAQPPAGSTPPVPAPAPSTGTLAYFPGGRVYRYPVANGTLTIGYNNAAAGHWTVISETVAGAAANPWWKFTSGPYAGYYVPRGVLK